MNSFMSYLSKKWQQEGITIHVKFNSSLSSLPVKWELFDETLEITSWRYNLWCRDLASECLVLQVVLVSMELMGTLMLDV